jgi:ATP-binding protein involved in chromosome partitioning
MNTINKEEINDILKTIIHPERETDIVSLGLIEDIVIEEKKIKFKIVTTSPDPLISGIKKRCIDAIRERIDNSDIAISVMELVRERKPHSKLKLEQGHEALAKVKNIIAIASGKGGVGKSTVAVNLAVALSKMGYKVGLTDADVYGPSIPKMTATEDAKPLVDDSSGKEMILPIVKFGIKWMSIGYFAKPDQPLIWRGPMASNALKQMILQIEWGELDFLIVDLPPGTGDIHISLVHDIPLSGAVIVTTPQDIALLDVQKGINMFKSDKISKPVLGLVENMSWFTPKELPDNKYYIFGKNGGKKMAEHFSIPLLAQIPIVLEIGESGDSGSPYALTDVSDEFISLAKSLTEFL